MPMPPAAETAATSSGLLHGYIAPQISGTSIPRRSLNGVRRPLAESRTGLGRSALPAELLGQGQERGVLAQRIGARRTLLTHIAHDIDHGRLEIPLPPGIEIGYDGLVASLD